LPTELFEELLEELVDDELLDELEVELLDDELVAQLPVNCQASCQWAPVPGA
jgi:hypothetical protein